MQAIATTIVENEIENILNVYRILQNDVSKYLTPYIIETDSENTTNP